VTLRVGWRPVGRSRWGVCRPPRRSPTSGALGWGLKGAIGTYELLWVTVRALRVGAVTLTCAASTVLTTAWSRDGAAPVIPWGTAVGTAVSSPPTAPPPTAPRPVTAAPVTAAPVTAASAGPSARLLPAVAAPVSTTYAFVRTGPDGIPTTYDPCRPVHYVLSRAHLTAARASAVQAAVRTLSAATGLAFVDDGLTDEAVSTNRVYGRRPGGDWNPVLVGWATAGDYPPLAGDVAGLGGSTADRHGRLVSGQVALDVRGPAPGPVLLHELGHLVGLAHVADPHQLMAPVATGRTTYAAGDLAGLAAAGAGPCQPAA